MRRALQVELRLAVRGARDRALHLGLQRHQLAVQLPPQPLHYSHTNPCADRKPGRTTGILIRPSRSSVARSVTPLIPTYPEDPRRAPCASGVWHSAMFG